MTTRKDILDLGKSLTAFEKNVLYKMGLFLLSQDTKHVINYAVFRIVDDKKNELYQIYNKIIGHDLEISAKPVINRNKITGRFE